MPRYIVTRTITITTEWDAENPKEAYETHLCNEWDSHDIEEQEVEIWDVTNPKLHERIDITEWNI